jgi:hypothetical protein
MGIAERQRTDSSARGRVGKRPKRTEGHPAFGMWAGREDMKDVEAWLRKIRTPRYLRDGESAFSAPKKARHRKEKP